MTTWATQRARLRVFLNDSSSATTYKYTDAELALWWEWAQDDLVQYVARKALFTATKGDESEPLPSDLYTVRYVEMFDESENYALFMRALNTSELSDENVFEGCYWYLTEDDIVFTDELPADITIHYNAYYPLPTTDETVLTVPRWAAQAIFYYCGACAATKMTLADANLRRFASKAMDSGTPLTNPFVPAAQFLMERYRELVYSHTSDGSVNRA